MTWPLMLLPGMLIGLGLVVGATTFRPQYARLDDAIAALDGEGAESEAPTEPAAGERLGAWWLRRRRVVLTPATSRSLRLKGRSLARHYSIKMVGLLVGLLLPTLVWLVASLLGRSDPGLPLAVALLGAAGGFVLPDILLRSQVRVLGEDATEALLTYFDLVTLERMANQSATQALQTAAALSQNSVFVHIRAALERARLQQRVPYVELKSVGADLELPALVDLADVMRLDESGAALASTLRARVKELRDAHLTALKVSANRVSERMTVFMVIPSLVFGLILLAPPILKLIAR